MRSHQQIRVMFSFPAKYVYRLIGDPRGYKESQEEEFPVPYPFIIPQPLYVKFGEIIHSSELSTETIETLRDKIKEAIENGIQECRQRQSSDA